MKYSAFFGVSVLFLLCSLQGRANTVDVAFCADSIYMEAACVAATSLLENGDPQTQYNLHVVHDPVFTGKSISKWKSLSQSYPNATVKLIPYHPSGEVNKIWNNALALRKLYKCLLPQILDLEKVLYLDAEVLVQKPVDTLWNMPLEDACILAPNQIGKDCLDSAIMLMDLDKLRALRWNELLLESMNDFVDRKMPINEAQLWKQALSEGQLDSQKSIVKIIAGHDWNCPDEHPDAAHASVVHYSQWEKKCWRNGPVALTDDALANYSPYHHYLQKSPFKKPFRVLQCARYPKALRQMLWRLYLLFCAVMKTTLSMRA